MTPPIDDDDDDEVGPKHVIKIPHNLHEILKDADEKLDQSSAQKMYQQLYSGIYLKQKKQKFWVDKNLKNNFMLYEKDLKIIWGQWGQWGQLRKDWGHWGHDGQWGQDWRQWMKDFSEVYSFSISSSDAKNVCWLQISVNFESFKLSPGTRYEVVFILMMKDPSSGWNLPVYVTLTMPDKSVQHMESSKEKQMGKWIEIPVGDFMTSPNPAGDMEIALYAWDGGGWKKGLVIQGVCIRPKISP